MRRLILEDPMSRAAVWSRNTAVFALLVAVIGIALARKGLDPIAALAIEGGALALGGFSILFAVVAMGMIWRTGLRGTGLALGGLALSLLLMSYPAYLTVQSRTVPPVADVSTDLDDPPTFLTTEKALKARHGTTPKPMSEADRSLEGRIYPDLDTITLDEDALDVAKTIHRLIKRRHWQIADEVEPDGSAAGHIDVVLKTPVMGFPADLTIRILPAGSQTRVDIRSVARDGWQEAGTNAARLRTLVDDIEAADDET